MHDFFKVLLYSIFLCINLIELHICLSVLKIKLCEIEIQAWEPSVAQGTHNYSHSLLALGDKLRY